MSDARKSGRPQAGGGPVPPADLPPTAQLILATAKDILKQMAQWDSFVDVLNQLNAEFAARVVGTIHGIGVTHLQVPSGLELAIIDHLHTFAYDRSVSYGAGSDAWTTFLHDERGFCQQFAGLMAIMLRELGIPARVAVGFTPGRLSGSDTYTVTGANLHAWVEVPFVHYGWLTFDPTPTIPSKIVIRSGVSR